MNENPVILGGRYELGRVLGHGGMAEVFLATDTRLHRTVAVKVLRSDLARDDSFQERFRREAQSAASLNHPSIVAVYDTGEDHRTEGGHEISIPYIVMEYVEGSTLRPYIHPGHPMDTRQAAEIMAGVLSALEYSHEMGIVHRDIKPGNIMITDTGAVKVMDFGIARAVADAASAMTQTQAVMGTAQYLSPEQARGQLVDARSDIYSAACVLYEMLTGRPPFTGDSPVSIAYQHVREDPVPPSTYNPALPPAMDAVVLTGLAKDRDERYPTAVAFSRDIAAVVAGRTPALVADGTLTSADGETTTVLAAAGTGATMALPAGGEGATTVLPTQTGPFAPVGAQGQGPGALGPATGSTTTVVDDTREPRKRPVWLFVLLGLALLAAAVAALLLLNPFSSEPETVAVPTVTGMTQDEASAALQKAGLTPKFTQQSSTEVEKGRVISTDPPANQQVATSSTVAVVVSSGPGDVTIPDLAGMSSDAASAELAKAGLKMEVAGSEDSADRDKGQVTRSEPGAGSTASEGDTVKVWTATGNVEVPNVVGMDQKTAEKTLSDAGFTPAAKPVESPDVEAGTVIDQEVTGSAARGSTVGFTVAAAPGPVTVPNVTGQPYDAAAERLGQAGFGVNRQTEESDTVPEGSVIRTDPGVNTKADPGATITVVVSSGAPPTPSPTPTPTPSPSAPAEPSPSPSPSPTQGG